MHVIAHVISHVIMHVIAHSISYVIAHSISYVIAHRIAQRDSNKCFLHPRHVVILNRCVCGRRALGVAKSTIFTAFTGKVYVRK